MDINNCVDKVNKVESCVTVEQTALKVGSGSLEVFATPMMVALMENASSNLVADYLENGYSTVGISLNIKHIAATKIGKKVWAISKLKEIDRKKLIFDVEVYDEDKKIGEGIHERFIINNDKFMSKTK